VRSPRGLLAALSLALVGLFLHSCEGSPQRPSLPDVKGRIYFAPLGGFPTAILHELVAYYRDKFGLTIEILPRVEIDGSVVNHDRDQLVAERLVVLMRSHHSKPATDPDAVIIGLTREDMYIRGFDWRFAFGYRETRIGVISTARMDPVQYPRREPLHILLLKALLETIGFRFDDVSDREVLLARLRKMTTRYIGILYYRLPASARRNSVLYESILGVDDLDSIGEEF
jgi:predicted Zn-dependent protease